MVKRKLTDGALFVEPSLLLGRDENEEHDDRRGEAVWRWLQLSGTPSV